MNTSATLNFNTYCRLCAGFISMNRLVNLHFYDNVRSEISKKLCRINALQSDAFNDNVLPKTVCFECINALNTAFSFVLNVEFAQLTLNNTLQVDTVKEIKTESYKREPESAEDSVDSEEGIDYFEAVKNEPGISTVVTEEELKITKNENIVKDLDATKSELELTWQDYIWTCSCCDTQFPNVEELKSHSVKYHNRCNPFRCIDCNRRKLRLDKFLLHVRRHRKYLNLSCYICFEKFSTVRKSRQHNKVHLNSKFICVGCNATFTTAEDLNEHKLTLAKGLIPNPTPNQNISDNLTCDVCQKTFKTKITLKRHLFIHRNRQAEHTCDKCGKCFYHRSFLKNHILLHNDARPFQCPLCKSAFKTKAGLTQHGKSHDSQKPYSCDQCGRCFRIEKQLNVHKISHTGSAPHVCEICNKKFRYKFNLHVHKRQHTGYKQYTCKICPRDFTALGNYKKHMKKIHQIVDVK